MYYKQVLSFLLCAVILAGIYGVSFYCVLGYINLHSRVDALELREAPRVENQRYHDGNILIIPLPDSENSYKPCGLEELL